MEKTKQNLKWNSYLVLFFAAWTLVQVFVEVFFIDWDPSLLSAGLADVTDGVILATKIIIAVITVLFQLPQVFVGCRGLKIMKDPINTKVKAALVWAVILLILSVLGLIDPITGIIKQKNVTDNIFLALNNFAEALLFFDFIRLTKILTKDAQ